MSASYPCVEDIADTAAWLKEWRFADSPSTSGEGPRKQTSVWINHDVLVNPCFATKGYTFFGLREGLDGSPNRGLEIDLKDDKLTDFVVAIQEHIKAMALEKANAWFGAPKTRAEIEAMYSPVIQESDKGYTPRLKLKVTPRTRLDRVVECHDDRMLFTNATPEHILPKSTVTVAIRLSKVWIMPRSFGVVFALDRCMVHPAEKAAAPTFYLGPVAN